MSRFSLTLLSATALATASIPAVAYAQAATDASATGDIIVTAQKRSERLQDVPITVLTQSAAQLEASGVQSTKDLTKVVPGLVFAQNESFSQPAVRGVTSSITVAGGENPIAIYLDGVYQPSVTGALYDLPDVDHIEVLKGPQGTLFGRNATGGAIQIFTKDPTFKTTGKFTVSDGIYTGSPAKTANEVSVNGFISGPVSDTLALSVSGTYRYNPGYMINDVTGGRSGKQETWGFRGKLLWKPADNVKVLASAFYYKSYDEAAYNRAPYNGATVGAAFPDAIVPTQPWHVSVDPTKPDLMRLEILGLSLKADIDTSAGTITSVTGYLDAKNPNFVNSSGVHSPNCSAAFQCLSYDFRSGSRSISQELDFTSKNFGIFSVTSGLFYFHNFNSYQSVVVYGGSASDVAVASFNDPVKTSAWAVFAELNADITDHLHVIAGGRYGKETLTGFDGLANGFPVTIGTRTDDAFTPRVSLRYSIDRSASIYATWSKGFRSGALQNPFSLSQPSLEPEKLNSFEVGFKIAKPAYSLNASWFHYDYKNMQLTKFIGILSFPQNAASATIWGFDVDGSVQPTENLKLYAGFNYTPTAKFNDYAGAPIFLIPPGGFKAPIVDTTVTNAAGYRLIRAPKFSGNIGFNWEGKAGSGKVGVNANLYHSSSYNWDIAGSVKTKPYEDLSAQIYYDISGLRFTLWGKNLLNKAAINGSQPSDTILPALYIAPRQVGVSASYQF